MAKSLASMRGRIGGLARAAKYPPEELTRKAREGAFQRFLDQVDEDCPGLSHQERYRRANLLQQAHMARISLKARRTRQRKAQARKGERAR